MTYEFIYMKNIVKSYLKSCVPRFQMAFSMRQHKDTTYHRHTGSGNRRYSVL